MTDNKVEEVGSSSSPSKATAEEDTKEDSGSVKEGKETNDSGKYMRINII